ncbi:hypothetical protein F4824DRAFT_502051 [Ustulina deusta]|nr:hypothetical protein F4824DRAFT_502051 [Ustulina deusta]
MVGAIVVALSSVTGLVASCAVDKLLDAGYRVRGTVHGVSRCSCVEAFFADRYGSGPFQLTEVSDLEARGASLDLVHVGAALATPVVNRKHLFAFGSKYNFSKVAQILQQLEPEKKILAMNDDGWDQTEVPNKRVESLVQALNGHDRKIPEDNITDYLNSIKKWEGQIHSVMLLLGHSLLICYHNH